MYVKPIIHENHNFIWHLNNKKTQMTSKKHIINDNTLKHRIEYIKVKAFDGGLLFHKR